ncbi:MAG TPA: hypothetical protein VFE60_16685 [Roseiarcus sp.]|jgi:hypothetical protein|nr:hypothetical protein [Roseiarcus sp.]
MTQIARVVEGSPLTSTRVATRSPLNDERAALVMVAARLLAAAADPLTQWTPSGRADAERCALEMLRQAGERSK